jgi:hypothetical protein
MFIANPFEIGLAQRQGSMTLRSSIFIPPDDIRDEGMGLIAIMLLKIAAAPVQQPL